MTAEVFLDSNILLYACSAAPAEAEKQAIAERFIIGDQVRPVRTGFAVIRL